jgi:hypothetical protein
MKRSMARGGVESVEDGKFYSNVLERTFAETHEETEL